MSIIKLVKKFPRGLQKLFWFILATSLINLLAIPSPFTGFVNRFLQFHFLIFLSVASSWKLIYVNSFHRPSASSQLNNIIMHVVTKCEKVISATSKCKIVWSILSPYARREIFYAISSPWKLNGVAAKQFLLLFITDSQFTAFVLAAGVNKKITRDCIEKNQLTGKWES